MAREEYERWMNRLTGDLADVLRFPHLTATRDMLFLAMEVLDAMEDTRGS